MSAVYDRFVGNDRNQQGAETDDDTTETARLFNFVSALGRNRCSNVGR